MTAFASVFILYGSSFSPEMMTSSSSTIFSVDINKIERYVDLSEAEKEYLFDAFMTTYNRKYSTDEEESLRYANFKDFLFLIDQRNAEEKNNGGSAVHGITQFADLSQDEFEEGYLGYVANPEGSTASKHISTKEMEFKASSANSSIVNWAGVYTTSVNNQVCIIAKMIAITLHEFTRLI